MMGRRGLQSELFDVGNVFSYSPSPKGYYGQLASVSDKLFVDDDFVALYSEHLGRPSVAPSLLALVLIMQARERISDDETIRRTQCDLDWAVVLRRRAGEPLCAKATLQMFRAQLLVHEHLGLFLQRSLQQARERKLLNGQMLAQAVDTKPIFGRGAVEDTYNLIAHGMNALLRAAAVKKGISPSEFASRHNLRWANAPVAGQRSSIKGAMDIDWSDEASRQAALTELVGDGKRLLEVADGSDPAVKRSANLLEQILLQDVAVSKNDDGSDQAKIKEGTARGRIPSVTDPQQRHGRKSASKRFTGHKASVSTDVETGLILAVDVLAGDASDATGVLELTRQAEANSQTQVTLTLADCAYGSGATRQLFEDAGRELLAKVPAEPTRTLFPKSAFEIVLAQPGQSIEMTQVTCPSGHLSKMLSLDGKGGAIFYFDEHCTGCSLRAQCTRSASGRSIHIHPQERLIAQARRIQATPEGRAKLRKRLVVENSLARLAALGIGQARFIGRTMTRFQLVMAATVANLRRVWNYAAAQTA